jgi:cobalt-precorrin-7 (C5)-methyltransferase
MTNVNNNQIIIIGCGPGDELYLTSAAKEYIEQADVLVGADKLLKRYGTDKKRCITISSDMQMVFRSIQNCIDDNKAVTVLVTGDPGIASLSRPIINFFGKERCLCIPGISSIQLACARLCIDWTEALIINAHKTVPSFSPHNIPDKDIIIILCGNKISWNWILHAAQKIDKNYQGFHCVNLASLEEAITETTFDTLQKLPEGGGNAVLVWIRKEYNI